MALDIGISQGCALKWPNQAGQWIEISFAEDFAWDIKSLEAFITNEVVQDDGTTGDTDLVLVDNADVIIFTADDTHKRKFIQNKRAESLYISWGADASARLADADYQDKCIEIKPDGVFQIGRHSGVIRGRFPTITGNVTKGYFS